jgi:hypothetical protein
MEKSIYKIIKKAELTNDRKELDKYLRKYKKYIDCCIETANVEEEDGYKYIDDDMYCPICNETIKVDKWKKHTSQNSHYNKARYIFDIPCYEWDDSY